MNDRIKSRLAHKIKQYMKFMSKDAAVKKVKRTELNRLDFLVDEAAKEI